MSAQKLSSSMKKMALGPPGNALPPKSTSTATRPSPAKPRPTAPAPAPAPATIPVKTTAVKPTQQRAPTGIVITDKAKARAAFKHAVENRLFKQVNVQITGIPPIRIREGTLEYDAKANKSVFRPAKR